MSSDKSNPNIPALIFAGLGTLATLFAWQNVHLGDLEAITGSSVASRWGLDTWEGLSTMIAGLLACLFAYLNMGFSTIFGVVMLVGPVAALLRILFVGASELVAVESSPGWGLWLALIGALGTVFFTLKYWRKKSK